MVPIKRAVLLVEGAEDIFRAKTAVCLLRYRPGDVVGLLDTTRTGHTAGEAFGVGGTCPIRGGLEECRDLAPRTLVIGIAPPGGKLPEYWRRTIRTALEQGINVVSGLHQFLGDDPEFSGAAKRGRTEIWDVRRVPDDLPVCRMEAAKLKTLRIATVGSDCNEGKMVTSWELAQAAKQRGWKAAFLPTGQTGMMLADGGLPMDRVISDFLAGAMEQVILAQQEQEILFIEGQGSINQPLFSCVTLGMLHGSAPQAMILCHQPTRKVVRYANRPIPPLPKLRALYEELASLVVPSRVIGISLNTYDLSDTGARRAVKEAEQEMQLPATDPVRFGVANLLEAVGTLRGK